MSRVSKLGPASPTAGSEDTTSMHPPGPPHIEEYQCRTPSTSRPSHRPVPTGYLRSGGTYPFPARASRQRRTSPQIVLAARACSGFQLRGRDAPGPRVTLKNAVAAGPSRPDHSARSGRIRGGASRGTRTSVPPVRSASTVRRLITAGAIPARAFARMMPVVSSTAAGGERRSPASASQVSNVARVPEPSSRKQQGGVGQFSRGDAGERVPTDGAARRRPRARPQRPPPRRRPVRRWGSRRSRDLRTGADQVRHGGGVTGEQPHAHIGCSVPVHQQPTGISISAIVCDAATTRAPPGSLSATIPASNRRDASSTGTASPRTPGPHR